ncbi:MAG: paraquat-inducible protein A [Magnetococcales bacterium]|nr:paraquat-inducible protein A [Magnetococcales bacterium]
MRPRRAMTAKGRGWIRCPTCGLPSQIQDHHPCPRCLAPVLSRKPNSLQRTWALTLSAATLYVPANVYPIMTVIQMGHGQSKTILAGVLALVEANMWPLALIVFIASVIVPLGKIIILMYLLISIQMGVTTHLKERMILYRLMETFGHWSMVDIFLVTMLATLVKMGTLATIEPEIGVSFFGAVVVLTLFAARAFDPRLIWDSAHGHL